MTTEGLDRRGLLDLMRFASSELYAAGWLRDLAATLLRDEPHLWLPRYLAAGGVWAYILDSHAPGTVPTSEEVEAARAVSEDSERELATWYGNLRWIPLDAAFGTGFAALAASDAPLEWVLRRASADALEEDALIAAASAT